MAKFFNFLLLGLILMLCVLIFIKIQLPTKQVVDEGANETGPHKASTNRY